MKPMTRRAATLALACSTLAGLTIGAGGQAFAANAPIAPIAHTPNAAIAHTLVAHATTAFPPLNRAALQAAIQTRPTDGAAGAIVRVAEPGQLWQGATTDSETGRQITGHYYKEEVTARILRPLHLTQTTVPETDPVMPKPYLHGYMTNDEGQAVDVSEQGGDPSNMISTPSDLDRFISALMQGRLLPPAQQNELFTLPLDSQGQPVPFVGGTSCPKVACFGAGLMSTRLPNGVTLWGKTGHDDGYANGMFATRDLSIRAVYSVSNLSVDFGAPAPLSNRLIAAVLTPPSGS